MKNRLNIDFDHIEESALVFKALALPVRLRMLKLISETPGMNISELAEHLNLPFSTAALHVRLLERAGLIFTEEKPGLRGAQKICAVLVKDLYFNIVYEKQKAGGARCLSYNMPLGSYFDCLVTKPCGLAGKKGYIGIEDQENAFYSSQRFNAQILWFTSGFLEYRFSNHFTRAEKLLELSFSFEACSEAPGYNNNWPSDITVWINGAEVFTFRSTGDYGDKRGLYTPSWWPESATQYGELHGLDIRRDGCFGDGIKTSDENVESLKISEGDFISFRIGVKQDAEYAGGLNLFGEHFGNYRQDIRMSAKLE